MDKVRNNPSVQKTDDWIKKLVFTQNKILLVYKTDAVMYFTATWMELLSTRLSEAN